MLESYYGNFGGQFAAETLMQALEELESQFERCISTESFQATCERLLKDTIGRPTALSHAERLSDTLGGAQIYLKREDLNHTGAHKINNAICQAVLAKELGKSRIVAETGAGQHGVATATACAILGLECHIYMGAKDALRQAPNVQRMQILGAHLHLVKSGSQTLKDAVNEALRAWIGSVDSSHYLIGSAVGPHPFPSIVRHFQRMIGAEAKTQFSQRHHKLPDYVVACVGGGSNAIGMFADFIEHQEVQLIGVQAAGEGLDKGQHAAPLLKGTLGVFQGAKTIVNQNEDGQILESHSVAPGLDYPAVGPEHAFLKESGRVHYAAVDNRAALEAFQMLSRTEGIIPALESAHAVAWVIQKAPQLPKDQTLLINLSGRGDKDLAEAIKELNARNMLPGEF